MPRKPGQRKSHGKWLRKEPKNLEGFFKKSRYPHRPFFRYSERCSLEGFPKHVMRLLEEFKIDFSRKGAGQWYIFPMAGAACIGDFMKGILHVMAPQARVTFLNTPKVGDPRPDEDLRKMTDRIEATRVQLRKCLRPGRDHVIVMDDYRIAGRTFNSIQKGLEALGWKGKIDFAQCARLKSDITEFTPIYGTRWLKTADQRLFVYADLKGHNTARRHFYWLGIATAKTWLEQQASQNVLRKSA